MIPEPIITLVIVVCVAWIFFRWGAPIFLAYALWHFCAGEWTLAALAFALACFIEALKAPHILWVSMIAGRGRGHT
jgi:hypothetical protein